MYLIFALGADFSIPIHLISPDEPEYCLLDFYLEGFSGPGLSHDVWAAWKSCHRTWGAQTWWGPQTGWCRPAGHKVIKCTCCYSYYYLSLYFHSYFYPLIITPTDMICGFGEGQSPCPDGAWRTIRSLRNQNENFQILHWWVLDSTKVTPWPWFCS